MHPNIKVNWMQDLGVHVQITKVLNAVGCTLPSLVPIFDFRLKQPGKSPNRWPAQTMKDPNAFYRQKFA